MPRCNACGGKGYVTDGNCNGTGRDPNQFALTVQPCPNCGGGGILRCPVCDGKGYVKD